MNNHIQIFSAIYEKSIWGNNQNLNYNGSSGAGSSYDYNRETYIPFLKKLLIDYSVNKVIDFGCGDFICGPHIYDDINVNYIGYDAYKKIIDHHKSMITNPRYKFIHLDFLNNKELTESGDLCILKDVLQHWDTPEIYNFLDYIVDNKRYKYILITNCKSQVTDNRKIRTGGAYGLTANMFPLKKYGAKILYEYGTKEVSLITII